MDRAFSAPAAIGSRRRVSESKTSVNAIRKKLVIVGDGECGKTSLLIVFSKDTFPEHYVPTVFETHVADVQVGGKTVELALWDTAGQEDYDRLRPLSYPDTDVILVCYSVDNPDSFQNVAEKWVPEIRHFCPGVPFLLVSTKNDLLMDEDTIHRLMAKREKPITADLGETLASKVRANGFYEVSAKTREGVRELFMVATKTALRGPNPLQRLRRACEIL